MCVCVRRVEKKLGLLRVARNFDNSARLFADDCRPYLCKYTRSCLPSKQIKAGCNVFITKITAKVFIITSRYIHFIS